MCCFNINKTAKNISFFSFTFLITAFVAFILVGCEKVEKPVYDNPVDPLSENFILPQATITNSLNQGSTLSDTEIAIYWVGVNPNNRYSYMLKGYDDTFSEWQAGVNTVTYSYLDEGNYTFFVKERYNAEVVQEIPDSLSFTIDAVTNCAILLRKWKADALSGEMFSLYLNVENVSGLKGITTIIEFPPDQCSFYNIEQVDNGFGGSDGMLLVTTLPEDANATGILEINAISLGSGTGLTGNATICKLEFVSNNDSEYNLEINSSGTELRDIANNPVSVDMVRGTVVNLPGN
jgi:hypothetical protein